MPARKDHENWPRIDRDALRARRAELKMSREDLLFAIRTDGKVALSMRGLARMEDGDVTVIDPDRLRALSRVLRCSQRSLSSAPTATATAAAS